MEFTPNEKIAIINNGFGKLKSKRKYSQTLVVAKLKQLDFKVSPAVMSRIRNSNLDDLTDNKIDEVFSGFSVLMEKEMCLEINKAGEWKVIKGVLPEEIVTEEKALQNGGFQIYPEGRLDIDQKVEFFSTAKTEMIEFGISLNSFTNYLNNRNPTKFKIPIIDLLKRGVSVKCYLLDPEWNGTKIYFEDRESVLEEGLAGIEKIRASIRRLKIFYSEISAFDYSKNFEVYTYNSPIQIRRQLSQSS